MLFRSGMSRTPEGEIAYLPNPYLKENLAFAFQMQFAAEGLYPGYTRKIYLKGLRYNLHLRGRSALIEVGAQTNTLQEAMNAMAYYHDEFDHHFGFIAHVFWFWRRSFSPISYGFSCNRRLTDLRIREIFTPRSKALMIASNKSC